MIIISTQCFPPTLGGIENLVYNIALHLARAGREVTVFADGRETAEEAAFDAQQIFSIIRFTGFKPWRRRKKARAIVKLARLNRITGVITDSWKSLEMLDLPSLSGVLCLAHGTELPTEPTPAKARRIRRTFTRASAVIANSQYTAERALAFLSDNGKLRVINPGVSEPLRPQPSDIEKIRARLSGHGPILITVSRLERRKGVHKALAILPDLINRHPGLLYIIIGRGSRFDELREQARELGIVEHVWFTGFVTESERNACLSLSDIFLLPGGSDGNDVEGFGIACIEAACFGLPTVAGRTGGVSEAVLHDQTGLIFPCDDRQAMLNSIHLLLEDPACRDRLGTNASVRADQLRWPIVIKEFEALLDQ